YSERLERPLVAAEEYDQFYRELASDSLEAPEILLDWAKTLMDAGQFSAAAERFLEFRMTFPGHALGLRTMLQEGQAWLNDREYDKAKETFRELITHLRGNDEYSTLLGEAYYGLGNSLESMGDISAALEAYRESLSRYPNRAVVETKINRVLKRSKERSVNP